MMLFCPPARFTRYSLLCAPCAAKGLAFAQVLSHQITSIRNHPFRIPSDGRAPMGDRPGAQFQSGEIIVCHEMSIPFSICSQPASPIIRVSGSEHAYPREEDEW